MRNKLSVDMLQIHLHELTASRPYRRRSNRAGEQIHGISIRQGHKAYSRGIGRTAGSQGIVIIAQNEAFGLQQGALITERSILCTVPKPPENLLYKNT